MSERICVVLIALLLVSVHLAEAQQPKKIPRIGFLRIGSPPDPFVEAFREGLSNLGSMEGRSIVIEYRWTEGKPEQLRDLAAKPAELPVEQPVKFGLVINLKAAKQIGVTIPQSVLYRAIK